MEIRRVLRGETVSPSPVRPAKGTEKKTASTGQAATDRVELSRQWVQSMEEQRSQSGAALLTGAKEAKKSNGILDLLDSPDEESGGIWGYMETEKEKLDAMSEEMDVQMKCLKISMNIMKGKKVPPQDEQYLMEHDPEGYKMAMAMKALVKEDKEECESVLKDGEKEDNGESSGTEEASYQASSSGASASSGEPYEVVE